MKVKDETELLALESKARNSGINTCLVKDAGKTEVEAGTPTVCAIGPCKFPFCKNFKILILGLSEEIDKITGKLQLYWLLLDFLLGIDY